MRYVRFGQAVIIEGAMLCGVYLIAALAFFFAQCEADGRRA